VFGERYIFSAFYVRNILYIHTYILCVTYIFQEFRYFENLMKFMLENFQTQKKQLTKIEQNLCAVCDLCILYLKYNICELHIVCGYVFRIL
jgi:hypothetical protein